MDNGEARGDDHHRLQGDEAEDEGDQGDAEEGDDDAGGGGAAALRVEGALRCGVDECVEAHNLRSVTSGREPVPWGTGMMKAERLPDSRKLRMPRVSAAATSFTG